MGEMVPVYEIEIEYDGGLITDPKLSRTEEEAKAYAEKKIEELKDDNPDWADFKYKLKPGKIDSDLLN